MSDGFNPYHKWLGIPVEKCPPTYYDLLQIAVDERDRDVILMAIERQKTHLQQFRAGKQAKQADRLIYELDEAELTLLNREMREEYDQRVLPALNRRNRNRSVTSPGFDGNQASVGEGSGLLRRYSGIVSILAVSFSIMAASVYLSPWKKVDLQEPRPLEAGGKKPGLPLVAKAAGDREAKLEKMPASTSRPALLISPFTQQEAAGRQREWAGYLKQELLVESSLGFRLVLIPPGEFKMGNTETEVNQVLQVFARNNITVSDAHQERINSGMPQHEVQISKPFRMSQQEVTQSQFREFIEATGYQTDAQKDGKGGYAFINGKLVQAPDVNWQTDYRLQQPDVAPVVNVSFNDASAFCDWLSEKEGKKYRLPTEAEWEYACRAGITTMFSFGDALTDADSEAVKEFAWFTLNTIDEGKYYPQPVMTRKSNPFGLFDMHGNVYEWCQDLYDKEYYSSLAGKKTVDPPGTVESVSSHLIRGGCWSRGAMDIRSGYRDWLFNSSRNLNVGFRVVSEVN